MWFKGRTVVIEDELIEVPSRWLLANVAVHKISAKLVQRNCIRQRFTKKISAI